MGATSSQLLPSQDQDITHTPNDSQEDLAAPDGAMDDPAQRDDDVIHVEKKRTSTDASRPLKRPRKERVSGDLEASQIEVADSQDATGQAQQQATEELSQKPRKKKAKKQHAVEGDGLDVLATQDSMISEQAPMSTADSVDAGKRVKTKRKRATGRPSGLNIFPAGMSDPLTQESAIVGAERSLVVESPMARSPTARALLCRQWRRKPAHKSSKRTASLITCRRK